MPFSWDDMPYTNFHELNLDWFINKFKEIFEEWESLYNQLTTWKDATDAELEAWKTARESDIEGWETATIAALDAWKTATETDIGTWETATIAALDTWKTAAEAAFEAIRVQAAASATAAAGSATDAETAKTAAIAAQTAAETAAESVTASAAQIATNTAEIADLKTQITDITGNTAITFSDPTLKQYINTNQEVGTVITWETPSTSATSNIKWAVVDCSPGDMFTINGKGGNADRLWAFLNSDKELLDKSDYSVTANNLLLTAPPNSAYLIINDEEDKMSYIGELETKKVDNLINETESYSINKIAQWTDGKSIIYINGLETRDDNFSYTEININAIQGATYNIHTYAQDSYGVVFKDSDGTYIDGYRNPVTVGYPYDISGTIPQNAETILIPCKSTNKNDMRFLVYGKQEYEINQLLYINEKITSVYNDIYNKKFFDNEYFFIKDNELICANTKIGSSGAFAKYCRADIGSTIKKARCKFKTTGGTVALITTSLNTGGFIDDIVKQSVHISYAPTQVYVSVFKDYVLDHVEIIQYSTPITTDGETEYEVGYDFLADNTLKVYLPDGTSQNIVDSRFDEYNGQYVVYEVYYSNLTPTDEPTIFFNRPAFTGFYAKPTTGNALRDNFMRCDGNLTVAPSGHVYRLARNATPTDTYYDEVNNIPQPT